MTDISFTSSVDLNESGVFTPNSNPNVGLFTDPNLNGWIKFTSQDSSYGALELILQWGFVSLAQWLELTEDPVRYPDPPNPFPFNLTIPFPNAIYQLTPFWLVNGSPRTFFGLYPVPPLQLYSNALIITSNAGNVLATLDTLGDEIATSSKGGAVGYYGMGWIALGY